MEKTKQLKKEFAPNLALDFHNDETGLKPIAVPRTLISQLLKHLNGVCDVKSASFKNCHIEGENGKAEFTKAELDAVLAK